MSNKWGTYPTVTLGAWVDGISFALGLMVCLGGFLVCIGASMALGAMGGLVMGLREAQDKKLKGGKFWASVGTTVAIDAVAGGIGGAISKLTGGIITRAIKKETMKIVEKVSKFGLENSMGYVASKMAGDRGRIFRNRFRL